MRVPRSAVPPKFIAPNHTDLKAEQFLGGLIGIASEGDTHSALHNHENLGAGTLNPTPGGPLDDSQSSLRYNPYTAQNITYVHALLSDSEPCIPFELHTIDFYSEVHFPSLLTREIVSVLNFLSE